MRSPSLFGVLLLCGSAIATPSYPLVVDTTKNVKYQGLSRNGIEVFLNIPYGQDTGGANRFKPPRAAVPKPGSTIVAQSYGPACPQALGEGFPPLTLSNVTKISEDCLNLNVARPSNLSTEARLPVLIYIHGGSFWSGQNSELTTAPDGMILESVANGLPVIHVGMNYRLGCKYQNSLQIKPNMTLVNVYPAHKSSGSRNPTLSNPKALRTPAFGISD